MIVKGGTAYVDAGNLSLSSSDEQTVTGLYSELETALRSNKPVIINLSGTSPAAAVLTEGDSGITASITGYSIAVTEDDKATVTEAGGGSGGSDYDLLFNRDFKLNTTGETSWDGTDTGTSQNSRMRIIDGWAIMQCTAEAVDGGLKIVPKKQYAYLTCQIPEYWFYQKKVTWKMTVNGTEYTKTDILGSGNPSVSLDTTFGQIYVYAYSTDWVFTAVFQNQIDNEFIVSDCSFTMEEEE